MKVKALLIKFFLVVFFLAFITGAKITTNKTKAAIEVTFNELWQKLEI